MSRDKPKPANTPDSRDVDKSAEADKGTDADQATTGATDVAAEVETEAEVNTEPAPDKTTFDAKPFLKTVTARPGVYRMYNQHDDIIYVGKAKNLKNRLSSYFTKNHDSPKTRVLVAQITRVELTVTDNPGDALVLEHNLIKEHRPRYNVLLRDDKSYPYVFISTKDEFPRVSYQRGSRKRPGKYIGPYPNAGAVKRSLRLVQKLFRVRQCEDSYFCLLYTSPSPRDLSTSRMPSSA